MYCKPSYLARLLNRFPHFSSAEYDPKSSAYKTSLKYIGFMSILLSALMASAVLIVFIMKVVSNRRIPVAMCHCLFQKILRACLFISMILLGFVLLFELLLHLEVMSHLPSVMLVHENINLAEIRELYQNRVADVAVKVQEDEKYPGNEPTYNYDEFFGSLQYYLINIQRKCNKTLNTTLLPHKPVATPVKNHILIWEWQRFMICMFAWTLVLTLCIIHFYSTQPMTLGFSIFMLVFLALAGGYLLAMSVAVADACQDIDYTIEKLRSHSEHEQFTKEQYYQLCESWKTELEYRIWDCRRAFMQGKRFALAKLFESEVQNESINYFINKYWPVGSHQEDEENYINSFIKILDISSTVEDWTLIVDCDEKLFFYDEIVEQWCGLCYGDSILRWFLAQYVFIMLTGVMFVIISLILVSFLRPRRVKDFKSLFVKQKSCGHEECYRLDRCTCPADSAKVDLMTKNAEKKTKPGKPKKNIEHVQQQTSYRAPAEKRDGICQQSDVCVTPKDEAERKSLRKEGRQPCSSKSTCRTASK